MEEIIKQATESLQHIDNTTVYQCYERFYVHPTGPPAIAVFTVQGILSTHGLTYILTGSFVARLSENQLVTDSPEVPNEKMIKLAHGRAHIFFQCLFVYHADHCIGPFQQYGKVSEHIRSDL